MTAYRKGDYISARAEFGLEAATSPVSQFFLAIMALRGEGMARDTAKGLALLRSSGERGYFAATYQLGTWKLYGAGTRDSARGKQLLAQAAAQRDIRAVTLLKILARGSRGERKDLKEVAATVKNAAKGGDRDAQYTLAFMYLIGEGVPKDVKQEILWYRAAAAGGDSRANFMLALMSFHGEGVPRNLKDAARFMRAAAERGNARAAFFLGTFYYHGTGVPQDKKEAARWIGRAAEIGYAEAQSAYGMLLLSGDGVPVDKEKAVEWLGKASRQGNDGARAVLRELVSLRGLPLGGPALDLGMMTKSEPGQPAVRDLSPRLEGKGVVLDRGAFSLKFSIPDVRDAYAPTGPPSTTEQGILTRLQGGKFEIIFRPDSP
jgi:hypothetical protein